MTSAAGPRAHARGRDRCRCTSSRGRYHRGVSDDVTFTEDEVLYAAFMAASIPPAAFGHREHIRVAFLFLRREPDFGAAAQAFRAALRRFVAAIGAEDRYHETLTWAYLALVRAHMEGHADVDSHAFLRRCPELGQHRGGAIERHYDLDALMAAPLARTVFVLPTRG